MDNLTKEQRTKSMSHIRSKDTHIEVVLRKALWKKGLRFRKNYKKLPGKPDIVFVGKKLAVFCDSEFFHGKDWELRRPKVLLGTNPDYWIGKIEGNMQRDEEVTLKLQEMGWRVLRFWGKDILKNTESCVQSIETLLLDN